MASDHKLMTSVIRAALCSLMALASLMYAGATALAQTTDTSAWVAPQRAAQRVNAVPADAGSVKSGRRLYQRECQKCHGTAGHGDGPQAQFLDTQPKDLAGESVRTQSDGALFWKISEGRGQMPKAMLNERELWTVVNYVRTLQRKP